MSGVEQVSHVSANYARKLTESIRRSAVNVQEGIEKFNEYVAQAKNGNAHLALGYKSWTAYISDTLSETPMLLELDARRALTVALSDEGMSIRAIAPIVGVSKSVVADDLSGNRTPAVGNPTSDSSVVELPPEVAPSAPAEVVTAPVERQVPDAVTINPATGEVLDTPTITEHTVTEKTRTVVGLDGKTYNSSAASKPRRSSLVDDAFKANTDLWKAVERIRTIRRDDRFTRNKADILAALQPSVDLALEILTDL